MAATDDLLTLAAAFPTPDEAAWRRAVDKVLAGKDGDLSREELDRRFAEVLVTDTDDGISIQPLYTRDSAPPVAIGWPGDAPFVRASDVARGLPHGWDVRQPVVIDPDDPAGSHERVMEELARGANSLILRTAAPGAALDAGLLDRVLAEVHLDLVPLVLEDGLHPDTPAESLIELWGRRGTTPAETTGCLGLDPLGRRAEHPGDDVDRALALAERVTASPSVHPMVVDASRYVECGGSHTEQLGAAVATGVEYLRLLGARGVAPAEAMTRIEFRLGATTDQFLTIATLRAARRLWSRVAEHLGVAGPAAAMRQHAVAVRAQLTRYDPWVNLLRGTVASMAAAVGGADSVTVEPFDSLSTDIPSALGRRMARNTQALLIDESHLAEVIDPGGGSYYLEWLTDAVARVAWAWFQEIEEAGGMRTALDEGLVAARIEATWTRRAAALAHRRDPITGVSEFPNVDEPAPGPVPAWATPPTPGDGDGSTRLTRRRYAEGFETLRERCDEVVARTGHRPTVVLANLGTAADFTTRSTFAKNCFEAGGLATVAWDPAAGPPPEPAPGAPRPTVACVCSSDRRYQSDAAGAIAAAREHGFTTVYLAGTFVPEGGTEALDGHVRAGMDLLGFLEEVLALAGVEEASS